jgi:hypothetical protein
MIIAEAGIRLRQLESTHQSLNKGNRAGLRLADSESPAQNAHLMQAVLLVIAFCVQILSGLWQQVIDHWSKNISSHQTSKLGARVQNAK